MKEYLSPKVEMVVLCIEQAIMASSVDSEAQRENYDSFDLFE